MKVTDVATGRIVIVASLEATVRLCTHWLTVSSPTGAVFNLASNLQPTLKKRMKELTALPPNHHMNVSPFIKEHGGQIKKSVSKNVRLSFIRLANQHSASLVHSYQQSDTSTF
jgi:hypothetical protein